MKTCNFLGFFIIIMMASFAVNGQGRASGFANQGGYCVFSLPDLTDNQKEVITTKINSHQNAMAELRLKQRSTVIPSEKDAIRAEMLQKVAAHRNEVRSLLNESQQRQFDLLPAQYASGGRRMAGCQWGGRRAAGYGGRGFRGGW